MMSGIDDQNFHDAMTESRDDVNIEKRLRVQITEEDLLCVNGCGFYGTPQCKGRCSKCWRAYQMEEKKTQDYAKNRELLTFEKFEGRRKLTTESRTLTLKSILRKSQPAAGSTLEPYVLDASQPLVTSTTPSRHRQHSEETRNAHSRLGDFLKKNLPDSIAYDVSRATRHAVHKIIEQRDVSIDDLSSMVQHFYQTLSDKMRHNLSSTNALVTVEEIMAEVEQYICVRAYKALFCARPNEEVEDLLLQDRIRSLNWVISGFLETTLDFSQESVRDKLDDATTEMIEINSRRGAAEKLHCLMRCSKMIFEALKESRSGAPASADEYLPVLIYIILKGNPPLIQSNVNFISRFALPNRVMSGESGYYFTNLSCALQFVKNMNAESLKMPHEQFEAYTYGRQVPPLNRANSNCHQFIRTMEASLDRVQKLVECSKGFLERIGEFEKQNERSLSLIRCDAEQTLEKHPCEELKRLCEQIAKEEEQLSAENSATPCIDSLNG